VTPPTAGDPFHAIVARGLGQWQAGLPADESENGLLLVTGQPGHFAEEFLLRRVQVRR